MDIEKLKILLQVAECGSVQGAARQMGVTRSSVRRSLAGLEAEIGAPLLHRDASGVRLTAPGAVLVEQGRTLIEASRRLRAEALGAAGEATGVIRVIEPVGMPLTLHVQGLLATRLALPNQRIVIRQVEDPLAYMRESFELMLHEGQAPDQHTWFSRVLLRAPLRLAASRAYLERRGVPTCAAALAGHDVLGWKRPGQTADEWPRIDGGAVGVTPWLTSADFTLLHGVAREGGGILLMPTIPFPDDPAVEPLTTVLDSEIGGELVFRATTPYPSHADTRTRETLRLLQELLADLPAE